MSKKSNINSRGKPGWFEDPARHALAARGIETANLSESEAKALSKQVNIEDWKDDMNTSAGKEAVDKLAEFFDGEEFVAEGENVAEGEKIDKLKELGGDVKDVLVDLKDKGEDWWDEAGLKKDEFLEKLGGAKEYISEKSEEVGEKLDQKAYEAGEKISDTIDEEVGETIEDELDSEDNKEKVDKVVENPEVMERDDGQKEEKWYEDVKETSDKAVESTASDTEEKSVSNLSKKELAKYVRQGKIIDANALKVSAENKEKLGQLLSNLRSDVETLKNKTEILKDYRDEKLRYFREEWGADKQEIHKEWDNIRGQIRDGAEKKRERNRLKNEKEMKRLYYKAQMVDIKSSYEYSRKLYKHVKNIYKKERKFVSELIA